MSEAVRRTPRRGLGQVIGLLHRGSSVGKLSNADKVLPRNLGSPYLLITVLFQVQALTRVLRRTAGGFLYRNRSTLTTTFLYISCQQNSIASTYGSTLIFGLSRKHYLSTSSLVGATI
jgi:hypothetical protein